MFLCCSSVFCQTYNKCPSCYLKSTCRGETTKLLKNLGDSGCRSESFEHTNTWVMFTRLNLTRSPRVINCYVNLHRNVYLLKALYQLVDKNAVELVQNQKFLDFFIQLFLVSTPNNQWRPTLDLSNLNQFLKVAKFKMETPETIRTSLQQGEWVTSIDFKDAYFHIPIQKQSRRFHTHSRSYQFKALPLGLSTAPMQFTVITKKVKLIRIHQYLDDWLVRARSHQACLQYTQDLVRMCHNLDWLLNLERL